MKKIANKINRFITFTTNIIESCISAIADDLLLISFLIATIIPSIIIKVIANYEENYMFFQFISKIFNLRSLLFNSAWYALIVALSFNFKSRRARVNYFLLITAFVYILTYANSMYFRNYQDFLSLSLIKQIQFLKDVGNATTVFLSLFDIVYWFGFVLISVMMVYLSKSKWNKVEYSNVKVRVFKRKKFLQLALLSFVAGILTLAPANYSQAIKLWNRPIVVKDFGLYNYHVLDIINSVNIFIKHEPSEDDYSEFLDYFEDRHKEYDENPLKINQYTNILKNKNVVIIHAESLESFVINMTMPNVLGEEVEVTPNFNQLAREGLYFDNFYTQHSIGTSADSEFVFNASLLPVNNGTVYMNNFDKTYVTTQSLLRDEGYRTLYMHGNNAAFWNRDVMYPVMGYDSFFSKDYYSFTDDKVIGLGINDYDFFIQSSDYIANSPKPFLATLITLTNHTPWRDVEDYVTYNEEGDLEAELDCEAIDATNTTLCRYLKAVHYMDWAFGELIEALDDKDVLDNTAIVIYGDHPANLPKDEMSHFYGIDMTSVEYDVRSRVPFIIWNKDIEPRTVSTPMAQYDIGPTLQNMLGVYNPYALGHDIFSIEENIVPFINGAWTDGIIYYDPYRGENYIIDQEKYDQILYDNPYYIEDQIERADAIIYMSNMIHKFDLIAYDLNKKENNTTTTD